MFSFQRRLPSTTQVVSLRNFGYRPEQEAFKNWTIVKGDFVQVIAGRYKQTQGKILNVNRAKNTVTVQGSNLKFKVVDDEEMQRRRKTI